MRNNCFSQNSLKEKSSKPDIEKKVKMLTCFMIFHISFADTWFSPERPNTDKTDTFTF
jgi:hypothetical protein